MMSLCSLILIGSFGGAGHSPMKFGKFDGRSKTFLTSGGEAAIRLVQNPVFSETFLTSGGEAAIRLVQNPVFSETFLTSGGEGRHHCLISFTNVRRPLESIAIVVREISEGSLLGAFRC
jgi:hypothetical protein